LGCNPNLNQVHFHDLSRSSQSDATWPTV
jgi:hypothetical protein